MITLGSTIKEVEPLEIVHRIRRWKDLLQFNSIAELIEKSWSRRNWSGNERFEELGMRINDGVERSNGEERFPHFLRFGEIYIDWRSSSVLLLLLGWREWCTLLTQIITHLCRTTLHVLFIHREKNRSRVQLLNFHDDLFHTLPNLKDPVVERDVPVRCLIRNCEDRLD